jgi:hypothetical protein
MIPWGKTMQYNETMGLPAHFSGKYKKKKKKTRIHMFELANFFIQAFFFNGV